MWGGGALPTLLIKMSSKGTSSLFVAESTAVPVKFPTASWRGSGAGPQRRRDAGILKSKEQNI